MNFGLSEAQLAGRRSYIGATDAARIMAGEMRSLWREKMGLDERESLQSDRRHKGDFRRPSELGIAVAHLTEPLNLHWFERETGRVVEYFSDNPLSRLVWTQLTGREAETELVRHPDMPWLAANLDGLSANRQGYPMVLDAKWLARAGERETISYTPNGTHQALVTGCDWWGLSIIAGGQWQLIEQEVDPFYAQAMLAREREFWGYMERNEEPPEEAAPVAAPRPQKPLRIVQLEDAFRDAWPNWAGDALREIEAFAATDAAAKAHAISREKLREIVPDDVGELTRGLFRLSRTRAGAVTMVLKKAEDGNAG